ncbi:hypothetical protein CTEN210_04303 [Chaetoceros tenuissimus]|uniref:MYND-type domain-containing protein n=1 Tax=Chaetoceros tenuissimus TaxID=426638 RepID=A0AAD3CKP3_9STRA|nr:hypothetical protein CTEN210_04303 [Chaetoceros tenuissimus]
MDNEKLFQKYYLHPSARKEYLEKENIYAEKLLSSVLALYEESHRCWRCNRLHGKGIETKALICAGCKCAAYCSRECQIEHWKQGDLEQKHILNSHKEKCKGIDETWSAYQIRKKSVGRAHLKGRTCTKPITVNGIEKECFLRPCEPLDYFLCTTSYESNKNALCASMDIFYENIATLACGGKHLIFGDKTISSVLEEQIRTHYEGVLSEFDPGTLKEHEISAMARTGKMLQYKESYLAKYDLMSVRSSLSVDRFITLYICFEPLGLGKRILGENVNKFEIEKILLRELKSCQVKNE